MKQTRSSLLLGAVLLVVVAQAWSTLLGPVLSGEAVDDPAPAPASSPLVVASSSATPPASPLPPQPTPRLLPLVPSGPSSGGQNLHIPEYLAAVTWLDTQAPHGLTREQAARLIPLLQRYQQTHNTIPEVRQLLLATLDAPQRAWLEAKVPKRQPSPDPNRTAEQIVLQAAQALQAALERR